MLYIASFHATEPQLLPFLTVLYFLFLLSPSASKSVVTIGTWPQRLFPPQAHIMTKLDKMFARDSQAIVLQNDDKVCVKIQNR